MTFPEFIEFPKTPRLSRWSVITEKLDGTNAQVFIDDTGQMFFGSRSRWLTLEADNYGFAHWATEHQEELLKLGPGRHFGEWWGQGVQRGYGLTEKRFSLFNVVRWCRHNEPPRQLPSADPRNVKMQDVLPPCVGLVPLLWEGVFSTEKVDLVLESLKINGSFAAPGFMRPEGVVVFHVAGGCGFKKTIEKDAEFKGGVA